MNTSSMGLKTVTASLLRRAGAVACVAFAIGLAGCATGPQADPRDPIEPFNRGVYRFNDAVDRAVLKPVATAYVEVTPGPVRTAANNFFGNLRDVWSAVNAALQLRGEAAVTQALRVGVNSTFGLGGLIDVATEMRLYREKTDFGQTLGRWGMPSGPYVVLPLMGPSTARDAVASVADDRADAVRALDSVPERNSLFAWRVVDTRAGLLQAGQLLDGAALDPYSFVRDAYLSRRQSQIDALRDPDAE